MKSASESEQKTGAQKNKNKRWIFFFVVVVVENSGKNLDTSKAAKKSELKKLKMKYVAGG